MKKWILGVIGSLVVGVLMLNLPAVAMDFGGYQTAVKALVLYNAGEEKLLAEENADAQLPIASLTKIMTALAVLEETDLALTDEVTVTAGMLANLNGWAVAELKAGMRATVEDLLYMLMLPSAGDAGQVLAVAGAGSIEGFAERMNRKAAEIGMASSHFSNPIGRDEDNYASARDVAKLLFYALRNEEFRKIFEANEWQSPALGKKIYKTVDLAAKDLTGAKTGFTYQGRSLASVATRGGVEYLLVVLDADWRGTWHIDDSLAIYKYYGRNYGYREILADGEVLLRLPVADADLGELEVVARDFRYFMRRDAEGVELRFEGVREVNRRVSEGDVVGYVKVLVDGEEVERQEVRLSGVEFKAHRVEVGLMVAGAGVVIAVMGVLIWKKKVKIWMGAMIGVVAVAGVTAGMIVIFLPAAPEWGEVVIEKEVAKQEIEPEPVAEEAPAEVKPAATASSSTGGSTSKGNPTLGLGALMLINPNFKVTTDWINKRRGQLVNLTALYGIREGNANNGTPMMDAEAAGHLAEMLKAYTAAYPGHEMTTRSCFRAKGTTCGRLCYATGTSDHHTGYTCDLIDSSYGNSLNTAHLAQHVEWQWLHENSWKYGFIDRFIETWAGGPMSQPVNVNAEGTTGLYETWHYRYVGLIAAGEIAHGKYNGGKYDSLEHYLKATGRVSDLLNR